MSHHSRRRFVRASGALGVLAAFGAAGRAGAQGAPLETTRIITGFPPGGTSDSLCRRVAEGLRGGTFVKTALVENKAGAGGQIAVPGNPLDDITLLQKVNFVMKAGKVYVVGPKPQAAVAVAAPTASPEELEGF